MPQDNVALIRTLVAHWNAGDRDVNRWSTHIDPAIEIESPLSSIAGEPYGGYAGIEAWMRDLDEQFVEWAIDLHDVRQVGERVVAVSTINARGRASGAPLEFDAGSVFDFAPDRRLTRIHIYPDVRDALQAVGLEE